MGYNTLKLALKGCPEQPCMFSACMYPFRTQNKDNGNFCYKRKL